MDLSVMGIRSMIMNLALKMKCLLFFRQHCNLVPMRVNLKGDMNHQQLVWCGITSFTGTSTRCIGENILVY